MSWRECQICSLPYDLDKREPRILGKCGHTLCLNCLQKSVQLQQQKNKGKKNWLIKCPADQTWYLMDKESTKERFPPNWIMVQILKEEKKKLQKQNGAKTKQVETKISEQKNLKKENAKKKVLLKKENQQKFQEKKKYLVETITKDLHRISFQRQEHSPLIKNFYSRKRCQSQRMISRSTERSMKSLEKESAYDGFRNTFNYQSQKDFHRQFQNQENSSKNTKENVQVLMRQMKTAERKHHDQFNVFRKKCKQFKLTSFASKNYLIMQYSRKIVLVILQVNKDQYFFLSF